MIAATLVSPPRVLFLDEPTVGLDPRIRAELIDAIAGLRASEGMTILFAVHYLDEAERALRPRGDHAGGADRRHGRTGDAAQRGGHKVIELRVPGEGARALATLRAQRIAEEQASRSAAR